MKKFADTIALDESFRRPGVVSKRSADLMKCSYCDFQWLKVQIQGNDL